MELEILKQLIKAAGSQKELSEKTDTPQSRISEWMNEKRVPKFATLIEMAKKIGFKVSISIDKI